MLHDFIGAQREAIIARAREKLTARPWPVASADELQNGVPLFLKQLGVALQAGPDGVSAATGAIGAGAVRHAGDLLALGFSVSQVVHDYGDICQAITEVAIEQNAPISIDEFRILNASLDTAIAEAVSEHGRRTDAVRAVHSAERAGQVAHDTRDLLNTALLAYHALKRGVVAINGSTGAVLGRSLMGLQAVVESSLTEIRVAAREQRRDRLNVTEVLNGVAVAAALRAELNGQTFVMAVGDPAWAVLADEQLLASAISNLLNNAFKFSPDGAQVTLRAHLNPGGRLELDVEDQCSGIPSDDGDPFQAFGKQRGADRTGLGLGLSIARKAVRAHGGDIRIRNMPGTGCVFTIDLPLVADEVTT